MRSVHLINVLVVSWAVAGALGAQEGQAPTPVADPAELAFEQGRWEDAIGEYREILAAYPEDRLSLLRIAQAQRELKRHDDALATLETARTANAPEAMIDLERARNLALLRSRRRGAGGARRRGSQRAARARARRERAGVRSLSRAQPLSARAIATSARASIRAKAFRRRATSISGSAAGKSGCPTAR